MVNSAPGSRPAARRPVVPERGDGESVHIFGDIYARYCNGNPFPVLYTRTSDGTRNAHSDKDADADMDKDSDIYPYIDFDEDGNPHIITDNGAILYEYARTVTITDDANT